MRQIWLKNNNNEIFDLTGKASDFLAGPSGFGYSMALGFKDYTLTRRATTNRISFGSVGGEVIFAGYSQYSAFIEYIAISEEIHLYYQPAAAAFRAKVVLNKIDKSEIDQDLGVLRCPVQFDLLGYWTRGEVVVTGGGSGDPSENQTYPMTYSLTYGVSQGSSQYISFALNNNGHAPAPLKITIRGQAINPTWMLGSQNGGLNLTVQTGQEVVIDSREDVMTITSGDTVLDQFKDHAKQNYIYAPVGESTLFVEATDAEVTLYEQFASV